jgi:hypothetical protein
MAKHKDLCQFFFHDTWWGGYHGENERNLWGRLEKMLSCKVLADYTRKIGEDLCMDMDAFQPSTSKIRTQFAGKSSLYMLPCRLVSAGKNGTLTVESLLRRHGLGAEAVIDDHESTWGLCAHSAGHDFQRSMFCGIRSLPWISEIAETVRSLSATREIAREIIDPL